MNAPVFISRNLLLGQTPNARCQPPMEAGATQLGSDKARSQQARFLIAPVENRTCGLHRIRLSTCGPSPWQHTMKRSFALLPHPRSMHRGPLARSLDPFAPVLPPARGLRRPSSSWCPQLSWAPTPLPHPTLRAGLGVSLGAPLPPSHAPSHPSRSLPCAAWQTHTARCRWRVARLAPSALCGSPGLAQRGRQIGLGDHGQRSSGLAVVFPLIARGGLQARLADRAAKGWQGQPFPQGLTTLQVMHHVVPQPSTTSRELVSPSWRLSGACCSRRRVAYDA